MVTTLPSDFDIFSPPNVHHAVVHPVAREVAVAERALGLRDLVLVVREDQVGAAAVDVERLAEVAVRHRRALDVPARAGPGPTGSSHAGSPGFAAFHSAKSSGLCFCSPTSMRAPGLELVDALARRACRSAAKLRHREVDVAADRVGEALLLEAPDDVDDLGDVLGRARLDVGAAHAERRACRRSSRAVYSRATSAAVVPSAFALRMILSSTSVMLRTKRDLVAAARAGSAR